MRPSHSTFGVRRSRSASVSRPVARDPEHRVAVEAGPRVEQHAEALARLVPAEEEARRGRRVGVGSAFANSSTSTPFGSTMYEPPSASSAIRRASAETAVRIVSWRAALDRDLLQRLVRGVAVLRRGVERADLRPPRRRAARRCSVRAPAARAGGRRRAGTLRSASSVRSDASFCACAIGEIEPLLTKRTLGPTEVTPGSGGGPSHGPMTRASTPSVRSARASPSTWPCTPPGRGERVRRDQRDLHAPVTCVDVRRRDRTASWAASGATARGPCG